VSKGAVLTRPGDVDAPVRQAERPLLLLLLESSGLLLVVVLGVLGSLMERRPSSSLLFVVVLGVLGSLVERRDVADCVAHLVHTRSVIVVPHGRAPRPRTLPPTSGHYRSASRKTSTDITELIPSALFHMEEPPGPSDFQRFEAPLCAAMSSMALLLGLAYTVDRTSRHAHLNLSRLLINVR